MTTVYRLAWTLAVLLLFFQPLFSQDGSDIYRRHRPCEVSPPAVEPKKPPKAEIEESSDRDPVQPQPKPKQQKKGIPDDRRIVINNKSKKEVFDFFLALARENDQPEPFRWEGNDGEIVRLNANPDGTILIVERIQEPIRRVQMPRQVVAAPRPFPIPSGPQYDPDHTCNQCGAQQWWVEQELGGGKHTHRCSRCGNVWFH